MKHLDKDIDWAIFEFLEGNLSAEEAQYVQEQIDSNEEWNKAHTRWKVSFLESEHIPYPNISELAQPKARFKFTRNIQWFAAASLLIAISWFWGIHTQKIDSSDRVSKSNSFQKHKVPLHVTHDDYGFGSHTSSDTTRQVAATLNLTHSHLKSNPRRAPQMESATALMPTSNPKKRALSEIRRPSIPNALAVHPSANVARLDSFSPTSAVRPLPPKTKNPSMPNASIFELLSSFFPGEIREEARLSWVVIESSSGTELPYTLAAPRSSAESIYIDTGYFQLAETPVPIWQQIWQRTKKGQLPAVQLALKTQDNSWIPSMNVNLSY